MVSYIYTMAIGKWGQLYDHTFSLGSSVYRHVSQEKCHNGTTNPRKTLHSNFSVCYETCQARGLSSTW